MDLQLSTDGDTIYTASTDKTICLWDTRTGAKIKKLKGIYHCHCPIIQQLNPTVICFSTGHSSFVNAIHPARRGPPLLCSASDDCNIKVWDPRKRTETVSLDNSYQATSVTFNDTAEQVISAGIDNDVKVSSQNSIVVTEREREKKTLEPISKNLN